jgi:hypothetical protein
VYLASEEPIAVVLRRGPSEWARLSLWHTDTDAIEHGQWLHGRVYERRSDLSPDGSLFAAFIRKESYGGEPAPVDSWVAVSRPPWFTALAVWYRGSTWHTGAFFPAAQSLWLGFADTAAPDVGELPGWLRVVAPRDIGYIDGTSEWTDRTVHFNRLLRDGWQLVESQAYRTLWQRAGPGCRTLTMDHRFESFSRPGGPYVVEYAIEGAKGERRDLGRADWADWDQQGRLVLAREGRLWAWDAQDGLTEIADFLGQQPGPQLPPVEAGRWP